MYRTKTTLYTVGVENEEGEYGTYDFQYNVDNPDVKNTFFWIDKDQTLSPSYLLKKLLLARKIDAALYQNVYYTVEGELDYVVNEAIDQGMIAPRPLDMIEDYLMALQDIIDVEIMDDV